MPTSLHLYRAQVVDTADPQAAGRVRIAVPTTAKGKPTTLELWVGVASMPLGSLFSSLPGYGVGDEVIVAAERLPSSAAVIVGRSQSAPSGPASASVTLALPNGQQLQLDADAGGVSVASGGATVHLGIDGSLDVDATAIRVTAAARIEVRAAEVAIDAGIGKFSGVVQCDTLIANSVVAASYSPGAGNVW